MVRQQLYGGGKGGNTTVASAALHLLRTEGLHGAYRGYSAAMLREATYSSLRFGLYEPIKACLGAEGHNSPLWIKILAGLSAGALGGGLMSPTDLLKVRMQSDRGPPRSMQHHVMHLLAEPPRGLRNLYHGVSTTVTRAAMFGATKMATYDQTKTLLRSRLGWKEEGYGRYGIQCTASIVTGLATTLTASPITNARTHIMAAPPGRFRSIGHCCQDIVRLQGLGGLYRGFGAQWSRNGPQGIVHFLVWEQLRRALGMDTI